MAELNPGSVGRRWIPNGGLEKHRHKIHRDSRFADEHKNLPFKFSKPSRAKKTMSVKCPNCGRVTSVPVDTVGMICSKCEKYVSVEGL